ncbi:MAG: hypothetical protein AAFN41_03760, partial [Planctomycetota bacterium]
LRPLRTLVIAWIPALTAAFVLGPIAGLLAAQLTDAAGGPHATLLVTQTPLLGAACALGVALIASFAGLLGVRIGTPNVGLFSAGIVLCWASARSGRVDEIIAVSRSSPFHRFVLEGLLVALVALILIETIRRFRRHTPPEPPLLLSARALGVGVIGAAFTAWLIAADAAKGQAIAAAVAAGIMGAALSRMMLVSVPPRIIAVVPVVLGILSPLIAMVITDDAVRSSFEGTLFRLALITPLDWLAGGLIGIPLGLAWTDSIADAGPADDAASGDNATKTGDVEIGPADPLPTVQRHA